MPAPPGERNGSWKGGRVTCVCECCGHEFLVFPCRLARGEGRFCSRECRVKAKQSWSERPCANCGRIVKRGERRRWNENVFCNPQCHGEWTSRNRRRELAGNWRGGGVIVTCAQCGATIIREKNQAIRKMYFCNRNCYGEWRSVHQRGESNPAWLGGSAKQRRNKQAHLSRWARKVKERAQFRCEVCGKQKPLHAHHIFQYALYPELREVLDNGIAVCVKCHHKIHRHEIIVQRRIPLWA